MPMSALPRTLQEQAAAALSALTSHLPTHLTVTSLSLSSQHTQQHAAPGSGAHHWLTITRCQHNQHPLLLIIPIASGTADDTCQVKRAPVWQQHHRKVSAGM